MPPSKSSSQRQIKKFEKGEIIFSEGDSGKEMYIIKSGKVAVIKHLEDDWIVLATLKPGDFFGEMALMGDDKRSATIRAVEITEAIVINDYIFRAQFKKLPDWFASMFKVLVKRIRDIDKKIKTKFKMGIQFSVLQIVYLTMEKFGTTEDEKFVINKELMIEKIHSILGISKTDSIKILSELKFVHLIEIEDIDNKIWIPDKERLEQFIQFVDAKTSLKHGEKLEDKLSGMNEKSLQYYDQLYKLLTRSKEQVFAFVPS